MERLPSALPDRVLTRAVRHVRLGETVDVALDRELRIDAVALLHVVEADVHVLLVGAEEPAVLQAVQGRS